ncbi:MAG: bifunctional RNase H/acid phosphatase [Actinomycetes bacterium]
MARSLIVEADGGSRGNPGPAAYGTVVRDGASGEVLVEIGEYIGSATNNVAEYRGAIAGLAKAREIDADARVEVRLDSKLVVEQMSGRWQVKHPDMRELAKEARAIFPAGQVTYTWVPRAENAAADRMVNAALDQALAGGAALIVREPGAVLADELSLEAEDVVGEVVELHAHEAPAKATAANRMVGWSDLGAPTTLLLARHGATEFSVEKRFSGIGGVDKPLNDLGNAQAQALAREIAERGGADVIVASPLLRTQQTADYVSRAIGVPVELDEGFAECAFGEWDGFTFSEVREHWPEQLDAWLASTEVAPPGGESFADVNRRVDAARRDVLIRHAGKRVIIVAHVTPIKVMVSQALETDLTLLFKMELSPCSLTTLAWFPDGNASMFGFSEAAHLRGVHTPDI